MSEYKRGDKSGPVWKKAAEAGREYITPEDVQECIDAGESRQPIWEDVLIAVDIMSAEDASLCAFLALNFEKGT